ncbi:PQQ-like beta-propeller repeat protein [candidate division KSB1 bacterium]|nr:PQQ-like beta-propeller repeat protein [candidate division KSB1 bacterium]
MVFKNRIQISKFLFFMGLSISTITTAADWPQFRGPYRNGISNETNLLSQWPKNGPVQLWEYKKLGEGYSSASIAGGMVYTTGKVDSVEILFAFEIDGELKWKSVFGEPWNQSFPESRTTPTVDGDRVYVISGRGKVACFETPSGKQIWAEDVFEYYGGDFHRWGIAESPLIVDHKVVCTPGGTKATMVALDKLSGKTVWATKSLGQKANYCSPILVQHGKHQIIVTIIEKSLIGINAENGEILWRDDFEEYQEKPKDINPVSPVYYKGTIYATSGYDDGGALYKLSDDGGQITRMWTDEILDTHHGGVVILDDHIYGSNWIGNNDGKWVCLDWKTGEVRYETQWHNKGPVISAAGNLYIYDEKSGHFGLAKATPKGLHVDCSFQITEGKGPHWAHPAISDGRLYIRHGKVLKVFDIRK